MKIKVLLCCFFFQGVLLCSNAQSPFLVVLGTTQDGGSPHLGCSKKCCEILFSSPDPSRKVVSLGIVDPLEKKYWMLEATPNFTTQASWLNELCGFQHHDLPDGIFITHAHIGHYTGLMYLGREVMSSNQTPVYAMTRMKGFLIQNGPWSQLVNLKNINLKNINPGIETKLSNSISIIPFKVPHRDEFSETVGYKIIGPQKTILFIPDIDKWGKWNKKIIDEINDVDMAFIDGTFYDEEEINYRDISEIPHPFIIETMHLFKDQEQLVKSKINFIHLNHTNPLLDTTSQQYKSVTDNGFSVAFFKQKVNL